MSFEFLAPHYRWMEFLLAGDKPHRCRTAFLSTNLDPKRILIVGEGNGRFLEECRRAFGAARIVCVDASQTMLHLARRRLAARGLSLEQVELIQADALAWVPPQNSFDLVVTHFFLDCFREDQLPGLVRRLGSSTRPGARWLLADFQIPQRGLARLRARLVHALMYAFFRVAARLPARRLCVPDRWLAAEGFSLKERRVSDWGLLHSDLWVRP
jgi:ubiquinone/menaquinone biosynthesis C-methylase UbiE